MQGLEFHSFVLIFCSLSFNISFSPYYLNIELVEHLAAVYEKVDSVYEGSFVGAEIVNSICHFARFTRTTNASEVHSVTCFLIFLK